MAVDTVTLYLKSNGNPVNIPAKEKEKFMACGEYSLLPKGEGDEAAEKHGEGSGSSETSEGESGTAEGTGAGQEIDLERCSKTQLIEIATKRGIDTEGMTKATILSRLEAKPEEDE